MRSLKHQLTRFLRFLKGEGIQDNRAQFKRFITILGLATLLGLLLSPLALLVTLPHASGGTASSGATPGTTAAPSGTTPTTDPNTKPGAPIKGLTDNPAYQWWRWPNHPQPDSWWGTGQNAQTLGVQISLMQELGVKLFRPELVWSFVAPTMPGGSTYNSALARDPNWSGYHWDRWDLIVQLTAAAGIQLVPQVVYTPDWASGVTTTTSGGPNDPPKSAQYFGDFVFAAATRYKGRIHFWEMWNEPDFPDHTWNATMKQYVDLILKPGYQAVKQVDPTAKVVLGGLANGPIDEVYAAGGGPYFDIGNFHAYLPSVGGNNAVMDFVRGTMNKNGDRNKPLWLTEFGYETYDANSEEDQALLVHDEFNGPDLQGIFFYQLHDTFVYDATGKPIKEATWGLVSHDFSRRKPSFAAYKAAIGGPLPAFTSAASTSLAPFSLSLLPLPARAEAAAREHLTEFRQTYAAWPGAARLRA
jgi:hypothetical protein